jgi:hypothetical protein
MRYLILELCLFDQGAFQSVLACFSGSFGNVMALKTG